MPLWQKGLGVLGLGLTALMGLRPSWSTDWISVPLAPLVVTFYLAVYAGSARRWWRERSAGQALLLLFLPSALILLIASRFGADATGRYLLPLYSALLPLCGAWLSRLGRRYPRVAYLILALVISFNLLGTVQAVLGERGMTTEFWSAFRFDRRSDEALIEFLLERDLHHGYSNQHTHFRIDFLSDEQVLLLPRLSSRSGLCINLEGHGDRYPPYTEIVENSPTVFYVTTEQPYLDALLRDGFGALGVTFQENGIGPYRVFHHLSRTTRPQDLCATADGDR